MKPFKIEDNKFQGASIEIIFERDITPAQARKLAKWLMKAADYVEKENGR